MSALLALLPLLVLAPSAPAKAPKKPPVLALHELRVQAASGPKRVRFASPAGWTKDGDGDLSSLRLVGPGGAGELLIVVATSPAELGPHLAHLKDAHPSSTPSPPLAGKVRGIDPKHGERATRFAITGGEVGEMMMIERGGVIVLYATLVAPKVWKPLKDVMKRCYPTVEVTDEEKESP